MVLQMLTNMRRLDNAGDADRLNLLPRSDPGQQQQMWRADRTGAHDHLLGRVHYRGLATRSAICDAGGDCLAVGAVEEHARRLRAGDNRQVRTLLRLAGEKRLIGA